MEKLAEEEKLEQLAMAKKRMKEQEHRREVEKLWQIKLEQYRRAKKEEQEERRSKQLQEMWKIDIIEREKERIIKEHAPNLEGFLHKDLTEKARQIAGYQGRSADTGYLSAYQI